MARAFTEFVEPAFKPIVLVIETAKEARDLRDLLGGSTGNPLHAVFRAYLKEYEKQYKAIEAAIYYEDLEKKGITTCPRRRWQDVGQYSKSKS